MNKQNFTLSASQAKYQNMRISLLLIVIFSAINLFSPLLGFYMLFSAYIPQLLAQIGAILYFESQMIIFYVVAVVLALLLLVPYLLCWVFSKKKKGWMIAALVLFSVDTLFFLIDLVSYLAAGDFSFILDLIFHIYALVSLIMGVKYASDMKTETRPDYEALTSQEENGDPEYTRTLTLVRKKSFVGCAMKMIVYVNGNAVCELKNGETQVVTVPCHSFALGASFSNALVSNEALIAEGENALSYTLVLKAGFASNEIIFLPNVG